MITLWRSVSSQICRQMREDIAFFQLECTGKRTKRDDYVKSGKHLEDLETKNSQCAVMVSLHCWHNLI